MDNIASPMEPDATLSNDWVHRRFFLSNIRSAPRLFCCNTFDGFTIGQLNLDNDELICEPVQTDHSGFQINHLCWLPTSVYRPSRKQIDIGFTTLPTLIEHRQATLLYHSENDTATQNFRWLDETQRLTPSSMDYNEALDLIAVSHVDGTVKVSSTSRHHHQANQFTFSNHGSLHQLKWNPSESHLLLLAHQHRLNIVDIDRQAIGLTLTSSEKEHLADCTWKTNDILIGRHRQQLLVWDKRVSREPIRNETLDVVGQSEKLKCSLASPNHLLSVYDSRLAKIKIYDFRFLTMRQVESFDRITSSFLDYHWTVDRMAIVVATHQGLLHWIDVDIPLKKQKMMMVTHSE